MCFLDNFYEQIIKQKNRTDCFDFLTAKSDRRNAFGVFSAFPGQKKLVQFFVNKGADVDKKCSGRITPLMYAVGNGKASNPIHANFI